MHLHNKTIFISPVDKEIIYSLQNLGINTVFSTSIDNLISYERFHADMQLLKIKDKLFIPKNAESLIDTLSIYSDNIILCEALDSEYPYNVSLNAALIGDKLFCKVDSLAVEVRNYCSNIGIKLVNVKQGYAKCSTLILNGKAIITADPTIHKAALKENIDSLKITTGNIILDEQNYGFIGGASGVIGESVVFFGNVDLHPDADVMKEFIEKHKKQYISLAAGKLKDLGGFITLN